MEQVSKKLFNGAIWLALARFLINCLGLLSTFVLARLLTPSDFGIVAIATSILAVALSVTDLSLASALVQRTDLAEEHYHSVWSISLLRSLAIFVVIALAAYPLARLYGDPRLTAVW
jgi:Membrane protein involved in the export of O-antigen and teichoic acid